MGPLPEGPCLIAKQTCFTYFLLKAANSEVALPQDLTGKTALVTGASAGLGAHFASVLARSGARAASLL